MIKIAVFNQKGGVGKTTLTVNLSSCFSERWGKKVLVVDADAQCNSSDYLLALSEKDKKAKTVYDLINKGQADVLPITFDTGRRTLKTNISLISGDKRVDYLNPKSATVLKEHLNAYDADYDFCFLDCSAQKTSINLLALGACDYILVPVIPDVDSINGYDMALALCNDFKKSMQNTTIGILGIVINDVSSTGSLDSYLVDKFGEDFKNIVFKSTIRHSALLRQARYFGLPINYYKKKSNITLDYYECALEIMERASLMSGKVGK